MYYTNNPSKNDILEAISNLSVSDIMDILSSNNLLDIFKQIPSMIFKSKAFKKIHSFFFTPVKIIESVDKNDDENDP